MSKRRVLIAIDGSEDSRRAFNFYLDQIHNDGNTALLIHISETPNLPVFTFKTGLKLPVEEWTKILTDKVRKAQSIEKDYEAILVQKKIKYKILSGETFASPGEGIVRLAEKEDVSLIVLGRRGLGNWAKKLVGSVSEFVMRNSPCDTLIIPR
ncbi:DgyrCDS6684 [Dimorphilus gyrociliatus]|uniref:DgyrCDS6684 n=1 Tax=Dimorphilus gyrociliatus TaxID=2664684 RepID=A0A7I8VNW7_9ANNE|nr:DgyrCDS6684 [Dimorphilus gyrociliatus]